MSAITLKFSFPPPFPSPTPAEHRLAELELAHEKLHSRDTKDEQKNEDENEHVANGGQTWAKGG